MIPSAWGNPEFSDLDILLCVTEGDCPESKKRRTDDRSSTETKCETRLIPGHKLILAALSKFFEAKIKRWMDDGSASGQAHLLNSPQGGPAPSTAPAKPMVKVECDSLPDLEAAEACLRTMYMQKNPLEDVPSSRGLDPDASIAFLLKVAQYGDLWQAECIARHCRAGLAKLVDAKQIEVRHINTLLGELPSYLKHSGVRADVIANTCSAWLLKNFEDVHEVVAHEEKRRIFCGLCPEAITLWADMDNLSCGSENDVAIALGYWSAGEQGCKCRQSINCGQSVNERLSLSLRVSKLTKSFRYFILPRLPFFTEHEELSYLNLKDSESPYLVKYPQWSAWYDKKARKGRLLPGLIRSRYECTWEIPGHLITAAAASWMEELQGPLLYVKGFFLRLKCDVWDDGLRVSVAPEGSDVIPQPLVVAASMRICHMSPLGKQELARQERTEYFNDEDFYGKIEIDFNEPNPLHEVVDRDGNCVISFSVQDVK